MSIAPLSSAVLREAATRALGEDRGPADITTLAVVPGDAKTEARIVARQACVIAGLSVARQVFLEQDASLSINMRAEDGKSAATGQTVLSVSGSAASILIAERSALNFLQQLSGVATLTNQFVQAVKGTKAKILDTRKTVPGLRALQKYAVACGGGHNHRMGLYDAFLIKDNHLAFLKDSGGSLADAVARARSLNPEAKLEVEADTLEQVAAIAALNVDIILLDNMTPDQIREAVKITKGRALLEASGGMTLERVAAVAETGVDFISIGALTHSAPSIDFGLDF